MGKAGDSGPELSFGFDQYLRNFKSLISLFFLIYVIQELCELPEFCLLTLILVNAVRI